MLEPVVRGAHSSARWASAVTQRKALADLDADDAATQDIEEPVDRANLGRCPCSGRVGRGTHADCHEVRDVDARWPGLAVARWRARPRL
jgi:hypothetical protein